MKMKTLAPLVLVPALTACGGYVSDLKEQRFNHIPSHTVGQLLDNRKLCEDINWADGEDDRGAETVTYRCTYRGGVEFYGERGFDLKYVQEVHHWTVVDGQFEYLGITIDFENAEGKQASYQLKSDYVYKDVFEVIVENEKEVVEYDMMRWSYMPGEEVLKNVLKL